MIPIPAPQTRDMLLTEAAKRRIINETKKDALGLDSQGDQSPTRLKGSVVEHDA